MVISIGARFVSGVVNAAKSSPRSAGMGALGGFIYAKFANLPAGQTAKAWAIWHVAQAALVNFCSALFEDLSHKLISILVTNSFSMAIGLHEMRKRGFMGDKMMVLFIVAQIIVDLGIIGALIKDRSKYNLKTNIKKQ